MFPSDKKKTLKDVLIDMFYPFIFLFTFSKRLLVNLLLPYYKAHKELVILMSYGVGFIFQAIILLTIFGFEGLNYLSIKFSLILFVIFLFLSSISILLTFFFVVVSLLLMSPYFAIIFIVMYVVLASIKWLKPELIEHFFKRFSDTRKIDRLYYVSMGLLIIGMMISFYMSYTLAKPVILDTKSDKQVIGRLLFSNQDYYFMDMCGVHRIFPSSEVNSITYPCVNGICSQDKLAALNKRYELFCSKLPQ